LFIRTDNQKQEPSMKFLIGLLAGIIVSVGVMTSPEPRRQLLDAVLSWVEKVKALPVKSSESIQPSDMQRLVRQKVIDVKTELFRPEPFPPEPRQELILDQPSPPGFHSPELLLKEISVPEHDSPEQSLSESSSREQPSQEQPSQELSSRESSSLERSNMGRSPSEFNQPEIGTESQTQDSRMFQVAWSPFRSETSAKGFASKLRKQLAHDFQVVKTGPGRYEVGFRFDSQRDRKIILGAINDLTGFESTQPPRIVQL
jgi:hypothetical protein